MDPDAFSHAQATLATGRSYHYVDQKPQDKVAQTTLLCVHGFPDLWYAWRHQIRPWVEAGYRVVVPDMLGYGKTDMPLETSAYSPKRLCDDLAALLDHIGVQKAVVIGHDWGSFISARFSLWYPERLLALVMLSTPYTPPRAHYISEDEVARIFPSFGYQVYCASEQSTAEIEARLPLFFRIAYSKSNESILLLGELQNRLLSGVEPEGCILDDKTFEYYISNFKRGVIGPLSYYRNSRARFEEERVLPSKLPADLPVLFLYGTKDGTCSSVAVQNLDKFIDQLKVVPIPDAGHWIMSETAQTVTESILQWLDSVLGPEASTNL